VAASTMSGGHDELPSWPSSNPYTAAVAPEGPPAAARQAAIIAAHLPDRPDLHAVDCIAWVEALAIVLKARSPHRVADIDRDAAMACRTVLQNQARIAEMWPRRKGNCRPSDKAGTAGQQGARASLDLMQTLQQAADAIQTLVCQSRLKRLRPQDSRRVELVTDTEQWSGWLAALAAEQGRTVFAVVYGTPAIAEPGDDGDAVLARYDKATQDCTQLERDSHDASSALSSLVGFIRTFLMAVDYLSEYDSKQPTGSRI